MKVYSCKVSDHKLYNTSPIKDDFVESRNQDLSGEIQHLNLTFIHEYTLTRSRASLMLSMYLACQNNPCLICCVIVGHYINSIPTPGD